MRHIIYKITNQINGKYYIGRHSTDNIDDGYLGSGKGILNAVAKYGKEYFTKEIIAEASSRDDLWELEKEIVNAEVVSDPKSYNMAYGGKHYLHGLKQYDPTEFIKHQSSAGKIGGPNAYNKKTKIEKENWHKKGGSVSSRKRSEQYVYIITTETGEKFTVNGLEFKQICRDKNWNYNTLHWGPSMGKIIAKGKHKGFLVEQISTYKGIEHSES